MYTELVSFQTPLTTKIPGIYARPMMQSTLMSVFMRVEEKTLLTAHKTGIFTERMAATVITPNQ